MPSRLRNTATAESAQKGHTYDIPGVQFNEPLTWRAGKPIPVGDLLTRLQKLAAELRNFDLDQVDSRAFTTLAHDLANANLLGHKDKGVRAWTASCVVDVLKICAPDAPFLEGQLKVRSILIQVGGHSTNFSCRTSSQSLSTRSFLRSPTLRMHTTRSMSTS